MDSQKDVDNQDRTVSFICNEPHPNGWTNILKEGFEVEFCGVPNDFLSLNGKYGKVVSISHPNITVQTVITLDGIEIPRKIEIQSHYMKFRSGDGYGKITFILQLPGNPDYIGERFVSGHVEGGSSNGCPAFLMAFDPANWIKKDIKRRIRSNMEIQSITDTDGANKLIRTYETLIASELPAEASVDQGQPSNRPSTKGTTKAKKKESRLKLPVEPSVDQGYCQSQEPSREVSYYY